MPKDPTLDEIQWCSPDLVANEFRGIHSNTVLFYFAHSPFFNATSNNAVLYNQALHNPNLFPLLSNRQDFENRLRQMSGLEFLVVEEPAITGPGFGTGVWVINKQLRRKGAAGMPDDVQVLTTYFVVNDNIYQAPILADVLGSRVARVTAAMRSIVSTAESIRTWTPSQGTIYLPPTQKDTALSIGTPSNTQQSNNTTSSATAPDESTEKLMQRIALDSLRIHIDFGTSYINENPITGEPGKFQLSSTGRAQAAAQAAKQAQLAAQAAAKSGGSGLGGAVAAAGGKDGGKEGKKEVKKEVKKVKKKRTKSTASTPAAS